MIARVPTILFVAGLLVPVPASAAPCLPPRVTIRPARAEPGTRISIGGRGFAFRACAPAGSHAAVSVRIEFVQQRSTLLATALVDARDTFRTFAIVPRSARPGRAAVRFTATNGFSLTFSPLTVVRAAAPPPSAARPEPGGRSRAGAMALALLLLAAVTGGLSSRFRSPA